MGGHRVKYKWSPGSCLFWGTASAHGAPTPPRF
nr:MAG TPA: hypothetical protein [Caudoviricetes sp.]